MNKKGMIGYESIKKVLAMIIFVIPAFLVLYFVFGSFIIEAVGVKDIHAMLLADHIYYDKNGLAYFDTGIKRVYPGMIDLEKFGELKEMAASLPPLFAAKMVYEDKEAHYEKMYYERWFPRSRLPGPGGTQEVLIAKIAANQFAGSGKLLFSILSPNQ